MNATYKIIIIKFSQLLVRIQNCKYCLAPNLYGSKSPDFCHKRTFSFKNFINFYDALLILGYWATPITQFCNISL